MVPNGNTPMHVVGVNHTELKGATDVVYAYLCTTNYLAPLAKVIHNIYSIREGLVTTVHVCMFT